MSRVDVPNIFGQTKFTVPAFSNPKEETARAAVETSPEQSEVMLSSALLQDCDFDEAYGAWLNLVSEDTLRDLWDTPEEDAAWRDLLKEI